MKNLALSMTALGLLLPPLGCDALTGILLPTTVTVSLVNAGDYDVDVELFIYDEQEVPELALTELGDQLGFTIPPGETVTFVRSCDDLQVIVVDDADLRILGGAGPETNSDVLRDGDDFGCGDRITFTFSHTAAIFDFDVTVTGG